MSKGMIFKSRFTPGLQTAEDVALAPGDKVLYKLQDGSEIGVTIKSPYSRHDNGAYGWEGVFEDDGQLGFVDETRVVDWEGRVP